MTLPSSATIKTMATAENSKLATKLIRSPMEAKNTGAKMFITNWWMVSRVRSRRWCESPMATPGTNAPKMEWMPRYSVNAALTSAMTSTRPSTPPG